MEWKDGTDPFQKVEYRKIEGDFVRERIIDGVQVLEIEAEGLRALARQAIRDVSFYLRAAHLKQLRDILLDSEASANDKYVAFSLLKNAVVSSEGLLPLCQDTGTATVVAWKGDRVWVRDSTGGHDRTEEGKSDVQYVSEGIEDVFRERYLRYSQMAPLSMFEEVNTNTNLPAQIDIYSVPGKEYRFLFVAKGGGSANKTSFFQESKALLQPERLRNFLKEKVQALGTAACPPYHLAVVVGGLSPEMNLKVLKLATTGLLDHLPQKGDGKGGMYFDKEWSDILLEIAKESKLGAQFGGKYLALDTRVIRLPRHAGSCPISIGVSCSADRNILAKITSEGIFLENLEQEPARYLEGLREIESQKIYRIDLNKGMEEVRKELSRVPLGSLLLLSGPLLVARDIAHARFFKQLSEGKGLPKYLFQYGVYYAGPAKTPPGYPIGSFGPTTAQRMDTYLEAFMKEGASLVTLAKGNRAKGTAELCRKYGGFYLGTIGGAAALLAKENILSSEVLDYPELDMEAVRLIQVKDFPAFLLIDDKGNDFYGTLERRPDGTS
ncbi:MAG: fumarate hydratase [Spirochaetales bacterium]